MRQKRHQNSAVTACHSVS